MVWGGGGGCWDIIWLLLDIPSPAQVFGSMFGLGLDLFWFGLMDSRPIPGFGLWLECVWFRVRLE